MMKANFYKVGIFPLIFSILFLQLLGEIDRVYGDNVYKKYYERYEFVVCGQIIQKYPNGYIGIDGPRYVVKIENRYKGAEDIKTFEAVGIHEDSNGPQRVQPLEIKERGVFFVSTVDGKYYSISNTYIKTSKCNSDFVPTPLGQYKFGIINKDVFCFNNDHYLITKLSDDSPACVRDETKEKLIERGWAKSI
jgi:hypothetical protein